MHQEAYTPNFFRVLSSFKEVIEKIQKQLIQLEQTGYFMENTAPLGIQAISIVATIALAVTATFLILKMVGLFIKLVQNDFYTQRRVCTKKHTRPIFRVLGNTGW